MDNLNPSDVGDQQAASALVCGMLFKQIQAAR
jgi:hypothetical protein